MANRVLLGNRSSGGYGLYISKPGQNVLTCSKTQLIFDSSATMAAAVHVIAGITISSGSSSGSTTWSALGYTPMALVTRTSAATGGDVLGMGFTFSSIFDISADPQLRTKFGQDYILTNLGTTGATVVTRDGANVSGNKHFRIIVFRFPHPT